MEAFERKKNETQTNVIDTRLASATTVQGNLTVQIHPLVEINGLLLLQLIYQLQRRSNPGGNNLKSKNKSKQAAASGK